MMLRLLLTWDTSGTVGVVILLELLLVLLLLQVGKVLILKLRWWDAVTLSRIIKLIQGALDNTTVLITIFENRLNNLKSDLPHRGV